jgi:hypothetical protein
MSVVRAVDNDELRTSDAIVGIFAWWTGTPRSFEAAATSVGHAISASRH